MFFVLTKRNAQKIKITPSSFPTMRKLRIEFTINERYFSCFGFFYVSAIFAIVTYGYGNTTSSAQ